MRDEVTFDLTPIDVAGVAGTRVTVTHRHRSDVLFREATIASARAVADAVSSAFARWGVAPNDDFTQAFGALHRRVVDIHQGESA